MLRLRNWPNPAIPFATRLTVFDTDTERCISRHVSDEELDAAAFDLADHVYGRLERQINDEQFAAADAVTRRVLAAFPDERQTRDGAALDA